MNHFEIFGLLPSVDVDVRALEGKYRELSLQLHPDRVPAARRLEAVQKTTSLNEAVKVLRDPVRRAFYLLRLQGVDLEREDGPARQTMPAEFLEHILEQREQLEAAKQKRDAVRARALAADIERASRDALASAHLALRENKIDAAAAAMAKVRYFARFLEEVETIEENV